MATEPTGTSVAELGDDPPWWLPGCLENIKKLNGTLCSEQQCVDTAAFGHDVCLCCPPYRDGCMHVSPPPDACNNPHPSPPPCCSYGPTSPYFVMGSTGCYCCCGGAMSTVYVAVEEGEFVPVDEMIVGDPVWVAMDLELTRWETKTVEFSSGSGAGTESSLIMVRFGDPARPEFVIANRDQLFLLEDRTFKRTTRLVPGVDRLVRPDGSAVLVLDLTAGKFKKSVHAIATSRGTTDDPSGHMIVANGVVCGDYALQLRNLDHTNAALMADGHAELPELGTDEYAERYGDLDTDAFSARAPGYDLPEIDPAVFEPFVANEVTVVPVHARSFVTREQSQDIRRNSRSYPVYVAPGTDISSYVFSLLGGFFKNVEFRVNLDDELPNVYAFEEYDVRFVVVTGGLLRLEGITYPGIVYPILQAVGYLYGGDPKDPNGCSCTGEADFAAISAFVPMVWFGAHSLPVRDAAVETARQLFDWIDPAHRGGTPGDRCVDISIDCRLEAIQAAVVTRPLPYCAGGPADPTLEVVGASAGIDPLGQYVRVQFNEAVDRTSATAVGNYSFTPRVRARSAALDDDQTSVTIRASLQPGREYTVVVTGVRSADGNPIVPGKDSATFELQP